MRCYSAIRRKRQNYFRTDAANPQHKVTDSLQHVGRSKPAIGIVEHFAVGNAQPLAGIGELTAPQVFEFFIAAGCTAMSGGSACGEAYDERLHSALPIEREGAAKVS